MYRYIVYFISRNIFKISLKLFFHFKVIGHKNIPARGSFILAGNHVSYLDPPMVSAACRRKIFFLASSHLYKKGFLNWWYTSVDCIKVNSGKAGDRGAIKKILDCLKKGKPVAIFPEGTRSEDGTMKEPLSGIGFIALKSQAPVVPCFLKGSEKILPRGAKSFKSGRVSVYIGEPIEVKEFKYEGDKKEAYRLFSKKVMHSISALAKKYNGN